MARTRPTIYWACQLAGWFALAATNFALVAVRGGAELWRFGAVFGASAVVAIAVTHGYRALIRRRRWAALPLRRLVARVMLACVATGAVITLAVTPVWFVVFGEIGPVAVWAPQAVVMWSWSVGVWSAIYLGVHYAESWRQAEIDKLQLAIVAKDAQLHGLMAQLQPHFLFNCLNSVRALVVEDPAKAQTTVTALSSLMRYSLRAAADVTVPLATELDMVRTYLALEAVRFEERLASELDVAEDAGGVHVPAMLVQGLVENGVKHGIERAPAGGTIRVRAWLEAGALRIRVTSPGRIAAAAGSTKIGLANARERLRLLYGPAASLALRDAGDGSGGGVIAEVEIPARRTAATAAATAMGPGPAEGEDAA